MKNLLTIQKILKEFGKILDLEALALNEGGGCRLMFDNDLEVNLELDDATDSLLLISPVAKGSEELFADALELNLFWGELNGCRFALLRDANILTMLRRISVEGLSTVTFEAELDKFLETVMVWRLAFKRAPQQKKDPAAACGWNMHNLSGQA